MSLNISEDYLMALSQTKHSNLCYQLIEEILFCWFKYFFPTNYRYLLLAMLEQISDSGDESLFPLPPKYSIKYLPINSQEACLIITNLGNKSVIDQKLALMHLALRRFLTQRKNRFLKTSTSFQQNSNRIVIEIATMAP